MSLMAHRLDVNSPLELRDYIKQMAIYFAAEFAYKSANPDTKTDIPSIIYEKAEKKYDKWIKE